MHGLRGFYSSFNKATDNGLLVSWDLTCKTGKMAFHFTTRAKEDLREPRSSFRVVEYDEGRKKTVELIPSEWLSKDSSGKLWCKWPGQTIGLSSLTNLVKFENADTANIVWKLYPARLIGQEIADYDAGLELADKAQRTSNIEASEPETTPSRPRKKRKHFQLDLSKTAEGSRNRSNKSSSDEGASDDEIFDPPDDVQNIQVLTTSEHTSQHIFNSAEITAALSSLGVQIQELHGASEIEPGQLFSTVTAVNSDGAAPVISIPEFHAEFRKFQEVTVNLLKKILRGIDEIQSQQQTSQPHPSSGTGLPELDFCTLPLSLLDELDSLENKLESDENKNSLIQYLSTVGGKDIGSLVRRVLARLFSAPLDSNVNFTGRNDKRSFKSLKLYKVFLAGVRGNVIGKLAAERDIELATQNFFRFANDRNGGRKKRSRSQHEPV